MKSSSKIAIAAAAVGAWLLAKKKSVISGIGRIGKVDYSHFDEARIIAKNGTSGIEFNIYRGNGGYITVTAVYKGFGERYGMDWEYLSTIGEYKTLSGAIRAAKKYWDARGIEYNPKDFEKL